MCDFDLDQIELFNYEYVSIEVSEDDAFGNGEFKTKRAIDGVYQEGLKYCKKKGGGANLTLVF